MNRVVLSYMLQWHVQLLTGIREAQLAYLSFLCTQPSTMWNQETRFWRHETCKFRGIGARPSTTSEYRVQHQASSEAQVNFERSASKHYSDWKAGLV